MNKYLRHNTKEKITHSNHHLNALLFVGVFIISSFANSGFFLARGILYFVFFSTILFLPLIKKRIVLLHSNIILSAVVLIAYNILIILINFENYTSFYNGILYSATIMFFVILISIEYRLEFINLVIRYMSVSGKVLLLLITITKLFYIPIQWVSGTSFLFLFLYFIYLDKSTNKFSKVIFTICWLSVAIFDETRTFLLLFPVIIILNMIWKKLIKNKFKFSVLFYVLVISLFTIPILYISLSQSTYAQTLNYYALTYTDSRFFSGRNLIWLNLLTNYSENSLLLGGGHHISPEYVYGVSISSHNTYVSVLTRTGIIGSLLFIYFMKSIWNSYYLFKNTLAIKLSVIFFVISLLKQSSELSLISNNIALSMFNWLVIAFGLIYVNAINTEKRGKQ